MFVSLGLYKYYIWRCWFVWQTVNSLYGKIDVKYFQNYKQLQNTLQNILFPESNHVHIGVLF